MPPLLLLPSILHAFLVQLSSANPSTTSTNRTVFLFVLFCFVLSLRNNQSILVCLCVKVFIHRYTPGSKEAKERAKELKRKGEKKSALLAVAK